MAGLAQRANSFSMQDLHVTTASAGRKACSPQKCLASAMPWVCSHSLRFRLGAACHKNRMEPHSPLQKPARHHGQSSLFTERQQRYLLLHLYIRSSYPLSKEKYDVHHAAKEKNQDQGEEAQASDSCLRKLRGGTDPNLCIPSARTPCNPSTCSSSAYTARYHFAFYSSSSSWHLRFLRALPGGPRHDLYLLATMQGASHGDNRRVCRT